MLIKRRGWGGSGRHCTLNLGAKAPGSQTSPGPTCLMPTVAQRAIVPHRGQAQHPNPFCVSLSPTLCLCGLPLHTQTHSRACGCRCPALVEACTGSTHVYPIFIIDPFFLKSGYK